jgi:hypothetical protein
VGASGGPGQLIRILFPTGPGGKTVFKRGSRELLHQRRAVGLQQALLTIRVPLARGSVHAGPDASQFYVDLTGGAQLSCDGFTCSRAHCPRDVCQES